MLNSIAETKINGIFSGYSRSPTLVIYPVNANVGIVGILTFMSSVSFMLRFEHEKSFLYSEPDVSSKLMSRCRSESYSR